MFLAMSVASIVFILCLLAKVTFATLIVRTVGSFLFLGVLGVVLGSVLEVVLVPNVTEREQERVRDEMAIKNEAAVKNLGDLLTPAPTDTHDPNAHTPGAKTAAARGSAPGGFVPISFPKVAIKEEHTAAPGARTA